MGSPFSYIFRFCCDPDFNDEREIESLKRFAMEADVDDVAVFCNVEEINTGHMTSEEQTRWLELLQAVQAAMQPMGITVSVNHWHSLMHADLGKHLRSGQNFRRMVDVDGREADLCVCPMCEQWQDYFTKLYARYASLSPNILWVEDDFRLHNHDPLRWGGCFCQAHMEEYSRRAGKKLTREEFVAGVLAPGDPHPYRKIWLDVNRETMRTLAQKIGRAVHEAHAQTRMGLMSSVPFIHAAEGRDWHGILNGLAAGNRCVSRIHLPCYNEMAPKDYMMQFNMVSMASRALIPADTDVYPELENYPYSLFAKSRLFTRFQMLAAMPLDLAGMTIDLFDLNGSGISFDEGYQTMLHALKPFLNELTRRGVFHAQQQGVCVMMDECSSYSLYTKQGTQMEELYPQEVYFAALLNAMGISYRYCTDPNVTGQVCAVSGQYFRNRTPAQIQAFFEKNYVIVSGDALETLCRMDLGELAEVENLRWMKQNGGEYTYEQICCGMVCGGIENARASAVISSADALCVSYQKPVKAYTQFYDSFRRPGAIGHAVVDGRVLVYPFGHFDAPNSVPMMQLNAVRREIMQDAIRKSGRPVVMAVGEAYLQPYCTRRENTLYVYLVNASHDVLESVRLYVPHDYADQAAVLCSDCRELTLSLKKNADCLELPLHLAALDACLVTLELTEESQCKQK